MTSKPCSGDGLGEPAAPAGFAHIELTYVTTFYFNQFILSEVADTFWPGSTSPAPAAHRLRRSSATSA